MLSFHNQQQVKDHYLAQVRWHREMDHIVRGTYWDGDGKYVEVPGVGIVESGRGCAVGCILHSGDHAAAEELLGIPEWLFQLNDAIHEGLPVERAKEWPERFLAAIPVGVDVTPVWNHFAIFIMDFIRPYFDGDVAILDSIQALHRRTLEGDEPEPAEWDAATTAARDAAWAAARAAATTAARDAAWAAATTAARDAATTAAWERIADKLIEILEDTAEPDQRDEDERTYYQEVGKSSHRYRRGEL